MIFDKSKIISKTPYYGRLDIGKPTWDDAMDFFEHHPEHEIDLNSDKMRYYLKNCQKRQSLEPWAKAIIDEMKTLFAQNHITLIKFYGFGKQTDSYPWHKDKMDVFLVQVLGEVKLKVENTHTEHEALPFTTGECVYIPRGTHHHIIPESSRVTFSFGVEQEPDPSTYVKV